LLVRFAIPELVVVAFVLSGNVAEVAFVRNLKRFSHELAHETTERSDGEFAVAIRSVLFAPVVDPGLMRVVHNVVDFVCQIRIDPFAILEDIEFSVETGGCRARVVLPLALGVQKLVAVPAFEGNQGNEVFVVFLVLFLSLRGMSRGWGVHIRCYRLDVSGMVFVA
jgi:hypothetical protein